MTLSLYSKPHPEEEEEEEEQEEEEEEEELTNVDSAAGFCHNARLPDDRPVTHHADQHGVVPQLHVVLGTENTDGHRCSHSLPASLSGTLPQNSE